jgi:hypothetical protein
MDMVINAWLEVLQAGIGLLPSAIVAIILLAGPTALWLTYHFVVQPRTTRYRATGGQVMWVCPTCRSVNELRLSHCYRCDQVPDESDLHIIDPYFGPTIPSGLPMTPTMPGVPVGPGRPELTALPGMADLSGIRGVTSGEPRRAMASGGGDPRAVGPGRPRPASPRRAVVVGRSRTSPADQDTPPAA